MWRWSWSQFCNCCSRLALLVDLHHGSYMALSTVAYKQVQETGRSVHEMESQMHAEIFLLKRDHWHHSYVHQEYVHRRCSIWQSTQEKERQCQLQHHAWQGCLLSWARMASQARQGTTFEQVGCGCNKENLLVLVKCLPRTCPCWPEQTSTQNVQCITGKVREDLRKHMRSQGTPHASTDNLSEAHSTAWSSAWSHGGECVFPLRALVKPEAIDEDLGVSKGEVEKGSHPSMKTPAQKMSKGGTREKRQTRVMGEAIFCLWMGPQGLWSQPIPSPEQTACLIPGWRWWARGSSPACRGQIQTGLELRPRGYCQAHHQDPWVILCPHCSWARACSWPSRLANEVGGMVS